jgi:hypothetical protein
MTRVVSLLVKMLPMLTVFMTIARANSSMASSVKLPAQNLMYTIRQASVHDIESIDRCNRETLPENYDLEFFERHLSCV